MIGTLAMLGITVLIVNVPSTNRNFRTSPKIAPYRHEQPTYEQDGSLVDDTISIAASERKILYDSTTTAVPTTEYNYFETTPESASTTQQVCCMPKCDIVARKSGMCDCLEYELNDLNNGNYH